MINSNSQTSSVVDEEIVIETPKVSHDFPPLSSDRSASHCSHDPQKSPTEVTTQTYVAVAKSSLP